MERPERCAAGRPVRGGPRHRRASDQACAGEARDDPTADDADELDDAGKTQPRRHGHASTFQMHQQVRGAGDGERQQHRQVAPAPSGDDLPGGRGVGGRRKGQIEQSRGPEGDRRRDQAGDAAEEPEDDEGRQPHAPDRHPAGPVGNGRQHEPGDGGEGEPEQHLVDVPGERVESPGQRRAAGEQAIHGGSASAARRPAARKKGRKARARMTDGSSRTARTVSTATSHLASKPGSFPFRQREALSASAPLPGDAATRPPHDRAGASGRDCARANPLPPRRRYGAVRLLALSPPRSPRSA